METIPSDNQIRNVLDGVPVEYLEGVYESSVQVLKDEGYLEQCCGVNGQLLVALDGTRFFDSEAIHCSSCSSHLRCDGQTARHHGVLTAAVVAAGTNCW